MSQEKKETLKGNEKVRRRGVDFRRLYAEILAIQRNAIQDIRRRFTGAIFRQVCYVGRKKVDF